MRESSGNLINIGIITDTADDDGTTEEIKYVSGLHISDVYAKDSGTGRDLPKIPDRKI